jgi:hypothetical protein
MKILLLGEYSNVHATLAKGLRTLGHECIVASNGDFWKQYERDIDLERKEGNFGTLSFLLKLMFSLPKMRGYDIVQLINPMFLELKAEHIIYIYRYLKRHNKRVILGAFGIDYYWVKVNTDIRPLRYSDFNIGNCVRTDDTAEVIRRDWVNTAKETLSKHIATTSDWIIAGLQEYWATYNEVAGLREKMSFIPFPIEMPQHTAVCKTEDKKVRIFIGISKSRSVYKGTDIMLKAAKDLVDKYPEKAELAIVNGVPFEQYQKMVEDSDLILDQLYSYTPAMNALMAMSKGVVNVGGGEEENYQILDETELRPIINVLPTYESCYSELEHIILHPEKLASLKQQSIEYIHRHHDYIKVARQYEQLYLSLL